MAPLEDRQQVHNRVITAIGNNSASNDHNQHKHDMNSRIINSASKFAAGKTLGLSEEETLALMSRELRRQQRKDDNVTLQDVQRQFAQAGNSLADVSESAEIAGVSLLDEPEVDPFGQDQGRYYEYGPDDKQYEQEQQLRRQEAMLDMEDRGETSKRYPEGKQKRDRYGQVVLKTGVSPDDYDDLAADVREYAEKTTRDQVAPRSVLIDALDKLESAESEQKGLRGILNRVLGQQNTADARGRLEDNIFLGPEQRAADASFAYQMNQNDLDRMSSRRNAYNNIMAQIEAENIGETMYRPSSIFPGAQLPAVIGDANLAAVATANPGQYPQAAFVPGQIQVDPVTGNPYSVGAALDPATGAPIGFQGPEYVTPNTDAGAALNAPMTSRSWMVEKQPGYSEGGRSFGNYPQADIAGATSLFSTRLQGLGGGFEKVSSNVRSIDELQRAVDAVIGKGGRFSTKELEDQPDGSKKLVTRTQKTPDIQGVLNKLRYTPAQEQQLANAMYQMEVAANTEINQQGKQQYFTRTGAGGQLERTGMGTMQTPGGAQVAFDAPEAIDPRGGQAPVARVQPGQTIKYRIPDSYPPKYSTRDITAALKELEGSDAQKPFIGAVEVIDDMGKTKIETDAGPGYLTRYNTTGESDPIGIEKNLRDKERQFQVNRAKKSGGRIMPVDEEGLRGKVVKAQLTEERSKRDAKKRREKERTISQYSMSNPANIGRVTPARRRV